MEMRIILNLMCLMLVLVISFGLVVLSYVDLLIF